MMRPFKGPRRQGGWFAAAAAIVSTAISADAADDAGDRADAAMSAEERIANRQLAIAENQDARSQQLFDRYMEVYAPLEDRLVDNVDAGLDTAELLGRANADVQGAHARREEIMTRDLARYGINPADGRFLEAKRRSGLELATDLVGAREGARRYADEEKFRRLGTVAALGRGLPGAAGAFSSSAQAGLDAVGSRYARRAAQAGGVAERAGYAVGTGLSELVDWASNQDWSFGGHTPDGSHASDYSPEIMNAWHGG